MVVAVSSILILLDRQLRRAGQHSAAIGLAGLLLIVAFAGKVPAQAPAPQASPAAAQAYASAAALQEKQLFDLAAAEWAALVANHQGDPLVPRAQYNLGVCRFHAGSYEEAIEQFALVADPTRDPQLAESALLNLGLAHFNSVGPEGAAEDARRALQTAVDSFDKHLVAFPQSAQNASVRYYRAEALAAMGKYADAVAGFAAVIDGAATEALAVSARLGLAGAALEINEPGQAEQQLTVLLQTEGADQVTAQAHRLRGEARLALSRFVEAAEDFSHAASRQADGAEQSKQRQAYCLYRAERFQAAADAYDDLASTWPKSALAADARLSAAKCLIALGEYAAAADRLSALWQESPSADNVPAAHWLVRALIADKQRLRFAEQVVEAALATDLDDAWRSELMQSRVDLSDTQAALAVDAGDFAAAAKQLRQLLAEFPRDGRTPAWKLRLASCLAKQQEWQQVVALLTPLLPALEGEQAGVAAFQLALAQEKLGAMEASVQTLSSLLQQSPPRAVLVKALYERGRRLALLGRLESSNQDFRRILQDHADDSLAPLARWGLGANQYTSAEFGAAIATLGPVADGESSVLRGQARYLLANASLEESRFAEALDYTEGAKAPAAEIAYLRGVCLARLNRPLDALSELEACLASAEADGIAGRAWYEIAWIHRAADRTGDADHAFLKIVQLYPKSDFAPEANYRLGEARYASHDFAAAEGYFQAAAQRPGNTLREEAFHLLGWARFEQGNPAAAAEAFGEQLRVVPAGDLAADAKLMLGECCFVQGDFQAALGHYQSSLGDTTLRDDLHGLGYLHAGQAAAQEKDWQTSFELLDRGSALADSPHADQITYERAWALHKLSRSEEAKPEFARLASESSDVLAARARFVLGELQFAEQDYQQAVRTFFQVAYGYGGVAAPAEFHEWQSQALFEAARCLEQLRRPQPARKLYAELIERFPESEKASHARRRLQPSGS